jgi:hypothetical protein
MTQQLMSEDLDRGEISQIYSLFGFSGFCQKPFKLENFQQRFSMLTDFLDLSKLLVVS